MAGVGTVPTCDFCIPKLLSVIQDFICSIHRGANSMRMPTVNRDGFLALQSAGVCSTLQHKQT
jgi:hypothetical protein